MPEHSKLLIAQSGGATAVINASLVGAIHAAQKISSFDAIIGARHGIEGILRQDFVELNAQPDAVLRNVCRTPSAALGTTRQKLTAEAAPEAVNILRQHGINTVAYIGGNDSADTAKRLCATAREIGYELRVISIPKTIDNDLPGTDHCPGYGSMARFTALATRSSGIDTAAIASLYPVKLIEVMGRNAGWVAAASALAQESADGPPHLIFFPERPTESLETFLAEISAAYEQYGQVVAVVPETIRDSTGQPLSGNQVVWVDTFGHPYFGGPGPALTAAIQQELGLRARYDKPGTISRMFDPCISETDLDEAYRAGAAASRLLADGESERMVTLERISDNPYQCETGSVSLDVVANQERRLPDEFIGADGRSVTDAFRHYALPLIGEPLQSYGYLKDIPVERG